MILHYFRDWIAGSKQKEEFKKMWEDKHGDITKNGSEHWVKWAQNADYEALLVQQSVETHGKKLAEMQKLLDDLLAAKKATEAPNVPKA